MAKIAGLKNIDKGIASLRGIIANVNVRVQELAVAIIEHAAGEGNGDVSRSIKLVQALPNSMRREYLIRFFQYFGSIGINMNTGKVGLLARENAKYRGFDVDGARANNWYEPFAADGVTRAIWYQGPAPRVFEPNTLGDLGENIVNFTDRLTKQLEDTRTVNDKVVPFYDLTPEDRAEVDAALAVIRRVGQAVARKDDIGALAAKLAEAQVTAERDAELLAMGRAVNA